MVFTYFHIWLALWMTFYPIEFFGCFEDDLSDTLGKGFDDITYGWKVHCRRTRRPRVGALASQVLWWL